MLIEAGRGKPAKRVEAKDKSRASSNIRTVYGAELLGVPMALEAIRVGNAGVQLLHLRNRS